MLLAVFDFKIQHWLIFKNMQKKCSMGFGRRQLSKCPKIKFLIEILRLLSDYRQSQAEFLTEGKKRKSQSKWHPMPQYWPVYVVKLLNVSFKIRKTHPTNVDQADGENKLSEWFLLCPVWILEASGLLFSIKNIGQQYRTCDTSPGDDVRWRWQGPLLHLMR